MDNRLALALALSLAILVGFQFLFPPPQPPAPGDASAPVVQGGPAPSLLAEDPRAPSTAVAPAPAPNGSAPVDPGRIVEVESDLFRARFASGGGRLVGFELVEYRQQADPDSPPYDLVRAGSAQPLGLVWRNAAGEVVDDRSVAYEIAASAASTTGRAPLVVTMTGRTSSGATITKTIEIRDGSYLMDFRVVTEGLGDTPLAVAWSRDVDPTKSWAEIEGPGGFVDGSLTTWDAASLDSPEVLEGAFSWAGYKEHYFLAAFVPVAGENLKLIASSAGGVGQATLWTTASATELRYELFLGPKSYPLLTSLERDLYAAIDLGWFWFVARPLLRGLLLIENWVGNFGWAIILLTVAVRILFYPVNAKQINAMKGMQRIQPEVKKLQERFKDNREKMNQEMMELYRRHKVNPLAGCLPMLLQLPVFIGLYNVLLQSIELRHAPFVSWIVDLSQPDRLGALAIPFVNPPGIPVMTLLMGASMFLQQKMTPTTADPAQQRIMLMMPVIFTVMFVNFPSGLVLYWLSNNVLSIGQQWLSNRRDN